MLLPIVEHSIHCWAWNRVYVKSNGRVPCWCDAGERYTIVNKNFPISDFVLDIVNAPEMRQMRLTIIQDNQHYINECKKCCCLLTQGEPKNRRYRDSEIANDVSHQTFHALQEMKRTAKLRNWPMGSIDKINEIQLEPSFPCNLRCPGCLHGWHPDPIGSEVGPYLFPLEWFKQIIDSIQTHAIRLERIAFVGRGEPTLNKEFPKMLEYARENLPRLVMSMDTNATQQFKPEYLLMDWINCSIDGSTKESYDTYRKGGNFDATISFMKQAVAVKKELKKSCEIRWKYILFNTNSNTELLNLAQKIAADIGIDTLNFVITACGASDGSVKPAIVNTATVKNYIDNNRIFKNTIVSTS